MKKLLPTLLFLLVCFPNLKAQYVTIPDANFRAVLKQQYPSCFNANDEMDIQSSLVKTATYLNISNSNISDLTGIEYFTSLTNLSCDYNNLTSLPNLPALTYLYCDNNKLTTLPNLPLLTYLYCSDNQFTSLPSLPTSLTHLKCSNNQLISLPSLPTSLTNLYCNQNQLTSLPILPNNLIALACPGNQLISLPSLPNNLTSLVCDNNQLTSLPTLPTSLSYLKCNNNQLTFLPTLHPGLTELYCYNNKLTSFPNLPATLQYLDCNQNQLKCLPFLHYPLSILKATGNQITCLPNLPNSSFSSDIGKTICSSSNNPNDCALFPLITGKAFVDDNKNSIQDAGENDYSNAIIEVQPGNYLTQTDLDGNYSINVDTGSYSIKAITSYYPYYTITPAAQTAVFKNYGEVDNLNDFALQPNGIFNDLRITLTSTGRARPGRDAGYTLTYQNIGTTTLNGNIQLDYDAQLNYDSASIAYASHTNNNLSWDYSNLKPGESRNIRVHFTSPTTIALGTELEFNATVNPISEDNTPSNNSEVYSQTVTGSYDPNFKEVLPAGDITPSQVASQDPFTYVVHFQNTGTDTAFVVSIKDTISTNFEILRIETIATSHNYSFKMKNGAAEWKFDNILLVDSITNEPLSNGFVKYRIIPKNTLTAGDEIKNTAHIFFDYNAPVKTNTTLNRVSIPTSISQKEADAMLNLFPNPTKGSINLSYALAEKGSIKVLSTDGRIISSLPAVDFSNPVNIDLNGEQKGIYFVQATIGDKVVMKKVIIQ